MSLSKPGWILASFLTCAILRFTSSATTADCVEVGMEAEPIPSTYLQMCPEALVEVQGSNQQLSMWQAQDSKL